MTTGDRTFTSNLVSFAAALRRRDVDVSTADVVDAAEALLSIDPLDRDQFYYGLRTAVIDEPSQVEVFDELFVEYWDDLLTESFEDAGPETDGLATVEQRATTADSADTEDTRPVDAASPESPDPSRRGSAPDGPDDLTDRPEEGQGGEAEGTEEVALEIGRQEQSTQPSVSFDDVEFATDQLSLLVQEFGVHLGVLAGFRRESRPTGDLDLRRALDVARHENPADLPRSAARRTRAKARFFVDVSQSMLRNMDERFLLYFLFESVRQFDDVRVFMFDTNATEVTHHFQSADVRGTLSELRRAQTEWGAGTTIGSCLAEIRTSNPFVVDRETVSIVISDGWDAGDRALLDEQMQGLHRRSRSVLWFNPRASAPSYEPEVGGMRAALPYVTHFFGFSDLADLRTAVDELRSRTARGQ